MKRLRNAGALVWLGCWLLTGCSSSSNGGTGGGTTPTLNLGSSTIVAAQGGGAGKVSFAVSGGAAAMVSVTGLPGGVTGQVTQPNASGTGSISITAAANVPAGNYSISVTCTLGAQNVSQPLILVVAGTTTVWTSQDMTLGINGQLQQFMSTSFQPAEWDYQFFANHPTAEPAQLTALGPQHIRLQGISQAVPWKANSSPPVASDWDFSMLDAIVQPVLAAADHSPEFQIAVTPAFIKLPSPLTSGDPQLALFVSYCQNLVRYYNTGGFIWGGTTFKSASTHAITWWGIHNEFNINGLTAADYVVLYNAVVPAMLSVDPTIKLSALELADFDSGEGDPRINLPVFLSAAGSGGVNAPVDVASTHFYSSCNQKDTDTQLFTTVPNFVKDVLYFRQELALRADLGNVAVWVTENNVNADFDKGGGISNCNGGAFTSDQRGTSAFFAAWRPYVFSQLAKAGNQGLYHWDYDADAQYGEVNYNSDAKYLSYWVDYTLGQLFPVSATSSPQFLAVAATETTTVESLATKNPDGSYVVMITNRAVNAASDNNGPGAPRTVIVDLSALGNYASVSQITLNSGTDVTNGPAASSLTPAAQLSITLPGYGTTFLHIQP